MQNQSQNHDVDSSRRSFFRNTGAALLAGYAFSNKMGLAQNVQRANSEYQSITVTTHEWNGDIDERLDFPKDWKIQTVEMAGAKSPVMTDQQIIDAIRKPIGTKQLRDIAAGKKTACVLFDDLTRPTPASAVAKHIINELNAAGIDDDHILFYGALGTHEHLSQPDTRKKLGEEVVNRCTWLNHDIFHNFVPVGRTSFMNRISVNSYYWKTDVKVAISGVKVHVTAGYGGGAKIILPGVSDFDAIFYNHQTVSQAQRNNDTDVAAGNPTVGNGKIIGNDMRTDMIEAARLAKLDFTVQIVYNGKRQPVAMFAGDVEEAHIEACRYANKHYTNTVQLKGGFADVTVVNRYPQCKQGDLVGPALKAGGSLVYIVNNPEMLSPHHYLRQYRWYRGMDASWWDTFYDAPGVGVPKTGGDYLDNLTQILYFSQYAQKKDLINNGRRKNIKVCRTWDEVLKNLEPAHKSGAQVAVYPYYSIQSDPVPLEQPVKKA